VTPRDDAASVMVGGSLYVIGGEQSAASYLASVERATVSGGTLSTSSTVGTAQILTRRDSYDAVMVGNLVHIATGVNAGGDLASVETAVLP
jgi:hypothetical protein